MNKSKISILIVAVTILVPTSVFGGWTPPDVNFPNGSPAAPIDESINTNTKQGTLKINQSLDLTNGWDNAIILGSNKGLSSFGNSFKLLATGGNSILSNINGLFDINTKGIILPRQSAAPSGSVAGTIFYDSSQKSVQLFDGTTWKAIGTGAGSGSQWTTTASGGISFGIPQSFDAPTHNGNRIASDVQTATQFCKDDASNTSTTFTKGLVDAKYNSKNIQAYYDGAWKVNESNNTKSFAASVSCYTSGVGIKTDAVNFDFDVNGSARVSGALTVGNINVGALAGTGNRCVYVNSSGVLSAKSTDCGSTGTGNIEDTLAVTLNAGNDANGLGIVNLGNVGIGDANPRGLLQVSGIPLSGGDVGTILEVKDTQANSSNVSYGGIMLTSGPGYDFSIGKKTDGPNNKQYFQIRRQDGIELITVDTLGRVGVGTTEPKEKLQIGTENPATFHDGGEKALSWNAYYNNGWKFITADKYATQVYHSPGNGTISLMTSNSTGAANGPITWNMGLVINKDGNVGIGTTNPPQKLSIYNDNFVLLREQGLSVTPGAGPQIILESPSAAVTTQETNRTQCGGVGQPGCPSDDTLDKNSNDFYICPAGSGGLKYTQDVGHITGDTQNYVRGIVCVSGTSQYSLRTNDGTLEFLNDKGAPRVVFNQTGNIGIGITNSFGGTAEISLAVGNANTGLNSLEDGALGIYSNGVSAMNIKSGSVSVSGDLNVRNVPTKVVIPLGTYFINKTVAYWSYGENATTFNCVTTPETPAGFTYKEFTIQERTGGRGTCAKAPYCDSIGEWCDDVVVYAACFVNTNWLNWFTNLPAVDKSSLISPDVICGFGPSLRQINNGQ